MADGDEVVAGKKKKKKKNAGMSNETLQSFFPNFLIFQNDCFFPVHYDLDYYSETSNC